MMAPHAYLELSHLSTVLANAAWCGAKGGQVLKASIGCVRLGEVGLECYGCLPEDEAFEGILCFFC